ncbi:hypothetical protein ACQP1W_00170 [Spirillospora sp. CA-255316]
MASGTATAVRIGLAVLCAAAPAGFVQPPASAHPHPSGSTDRVTPGVVRVEATAKIAITLLDHQAQQLKHVTREYTVPLGTGSGFTVAPEGVIVTATGVVRPAGDPQVYAANRIVADRYKESIPADFQRHQAGDPHADEQLQDCYPPNDADSTCLIRVTPSVMIFPATDPPRSQGLAGTVATAGKAPEDAAVVKIAQGSGTTLPTVPVAESVPAAVTALNVAAYTGRPAAGNPVPTAQIAHFESAGSRTFKAEDRDRLTKLVRAGGNGGALIDNGKSDVIGIVTADGGGRLTSTPIEEIRSVLNGTGSTVRRGPVDVVYERALAPYHTRRYGDSVPLLQQVLKLRPDHAVAAEHLRTAMARSGTAQDAGKERAADDGTEGGGAAPWIWRAVGAAALILVAGAVLFLLWRPQAVDLPRLMRSAHLFPRPADDGSTKGRDQPRKGEAATHKDRATMRTDVPGAPESAPPEPAPPESAPPESTPSTPAPPAPARPEGEGRTGRFCTRCGMRLGHGHQFCAFCGQQVGT